MDTDHGVEFEEAFAKEMGLERVPGSGSTWYSKLDLKGFGARWSLKSTRKRTYVLSTALLEEAQAATGAPGGTGEISLHGFQLHGEWLILMSASDFKLLAKEELVLVRESKGEARRRQAAIPELMRDD